MKDCTKRLLKAFDRETNRIRCCPRDGCENNCKYSDLNQDKQQTKLKGD